MDKKRQTLFGNDESKLSIHICMELQEFKDISKLFMDYDGEVQINPFAKNKPPAVVTSELVTRMGEFSKPFGLGTSVALSLVVCAPLLAH